MLAHERQTIIIEHLREHRVIKIADMVERFGISSLTARRDLDALRDRGILRRVYGGAVLTADPATLAGEAMLQPAQSNREREAQKGRKALAKLAASLVQEGDILFLGNGTTIHEVSRNLRHFSNLTIITSSLAVINEMASTANTVYILGGLLDGNEHSIGTLGDYELLERFCADKAFISCDGASLQHGITSYNPVGVEIGRIMVRNSDHAVLVGSHSMFGNTGLRIVCPLSEMGTIVTDDQLPQEYREGIRKMGIELLIAEVEKEGKEE